MESVHDIQDAVSEILGREHRNRRGSNGTEDNFDAERQSAYGMTTGASRHYAPSVMPTTNYIPEYRLGRDDPTIFPIQEVIPNSQEAMEELAARSRRRARAAAAHHAASAQASMAARSRAPSMGGSRTNTLNVGDLYKSTNLDNATVADGEQRSGVDPLEGEQEGELLDDGMGGEFEYPDEVPLVVKPKILHQNPQTPTVLPSTFHPISKWSAVKQYYLKEFLAEWLGTMMMVFFGHCVDIQVNAGAQIQKNEYFAAVAELNRTRAVTNDTLHILNTMPLLVSTTPSGTYNNVPLGWASAVVMGYFSSGGSAISGAHLNPAATVTTFFFRGFPAKKMPIYFAGQLMGGFCACMLSYIFYKRVIMEGYPNWYESETVASFFVTYPRPYLSTERQITSEFMCTAAMQLCVFALTDPYTSLAADVFPLLLFLMALVVNSSMSFQTGSAMNTARDLGPRLALWALGFDRKNLWIHHHRYFWVPMIVPFWGSMVGALIYDFFIYQGHESPVNWPLAVYKEKFQKFWHRRPGWNNRNRKRALSDLSDFSYHNDEDAGSGSEKGESLKAKKTDTNDVPPRPEESGKFVRFTSVSRQGGGRRDRTNQHATTVLEEESIETASLGNSQSNSFDQRSAHEVGDEKNSS